MRLRERKHRDRRRRDEVKIDELMIRTGVVSADEVRRRHDVAIKTYDDAVREMLGSPRAQVKNTNEWRVALAHNLRTMRKYHTPTGGNPLADLVAFLRVVGKYTDPQSSLTYEEQYTAGIPSYMIVDHWYRCMTAMPGVPLEHLERAMVYVERRMELVPRNSHRARCNRDWLGRWSRAILAELERRARQGDLAAPPVRDGLKCTWLEIEQSRWIPPVAFEQLPPQPVDTTIEIPEVRIGPTIVVDNPSLNWDDI